MNSYVIDATVILLFSFKSLNCNILLLAKKRKRAETNRKLGVKRLKLDMPAKKVFPWNFFTEREMPERSEGEIEKAMPA